MEKRLYDSVLIYSESGAPLSMLLIVLFMINHRPFIREGVKKNREKSGQADRLGRPPLPLPRSGKCEKFSTSCHIWGYFAIL